MAQHGGLRGGHRHQSTRPHRCPRPVDRSTMDLADGGTLTVDFDETTVTWTASGVDWAGGGTDDVRGGPDRRRRLLGRLLDRRPAGRDGDAGVLTRRRVGARRALRHPRRGLHHRDTVMQTLPCRSPGRVVVRAWFSRTHPRPDRQAHSLPVQLASPLRAHLSQLSPIRLAQPDRRATRSRSRRADDHLPARDGHVPVHLARGEDPGRHGLRVRLRARALDRQVHRPHRRRVESRTVRGERRSSSSGSRTTPRTPNRSDRMRRAPRSAIDRRSHLNSREKCAASMNPHRAAIVPIGRSASNGSRRSRRQCSRRRVRTQVETVVPSSRNSPCRCRVEMKCAAAIAAGSSCGSPR